MVFTKKLMQMIFVFMFILLFLDLSSFFWVQGFSLVFFVVVEMFGFFLQSIFKVVYDSAREECPVMVRGNDVSPAYTENTEVKSCFS